MEGKEQKEKNKKTTKKKTIIIVIIALVSVCALFLLYKFVIRNYINREVRYKEVLVFEKRVKNYCDKVEKYVTEYMEANGEVPDYYDIMSKVYTIDPGLHCNTTINNDGSIYVNSCSEEIARNAHSTVYSRPDWPYGYSDGCGTQGIDKKIYFYTSKNGTYIHSNEKYPSKETNIINKYFCQKNNCKVYNTGSESPYSFVIYDNKKYYLYNPENKEKKQLNLGEEPVITADFIKSNGKKYGLLVKKNEDTFAIYSFNQDKYIADFKGNYSQYYSNNSLILELGYFTLEKTINNVPYIYVISQNDGSIIKEITNALFLAAYKLGDNVIYKATQSGSQCAANDNKLYDSQFNPLIGEDNIYYNINNSDDTITIESEDKKSFDIYNYNQKIYSSQKYKRIVALVEDYIFVIDEEDNLKLLNTKEEVVANFSKVEKGYTILKRQVGHITYEGVEKVTIQATNKEIEYQDEKKFITYIYYPQTNTTKIEYSPGKGAAICIDELK